MSRRSPCSRSLSRVLALANLLCCVGMARAQTVAPAREPVPGDALLIACQESVSCRTHLEKATQLYKQERLEDALDEYQAAYVLQPYPLILYNIARIYHKQGQHAEAVSYYQRYLDTGHPQLAERTRDFLAQAHQDRQKKESPPQQLAPPQQPPDPPPALVVRTPLRSTAPASVAAAHSSNAPIYKSWWLWTLTSIVVIGAATGIGIGLYARGPDVSGLPAKSFTFGN